MGLDVKLMEIVMSSVPFKMAFKLDGARQKCKMATTTLGKLFKKN